MERETIVRLHNASQALTKLCNVWAELNNLWADPTVAEILDQNYPFSESFDELLSKVEDWNFLTGEELDIAWSVAEIEEKIDSLGLSDTGTVQIIKKLNAIYADEIAAYDADMAEAEKES